MKKVSLLVASAAILFSTTVMAQTTPAQDGKAKTDKKEAKKDDKKEVKKVKSTKTAEKKDAKKDEKAAGAK